ncbi:amidohydrolase [Qipengyuania sp. CAU 1752]
MKLRTILAAIGLAVIAAPAAADTLIFNVDGIRINEQREIDRFAAMLISDEGRILQILDRKAKLPPAEYAVDGKGRTVIPGLIDAHLHVMGVGFGALTLDLSETRSLAEAQAKIAEFAAANPGGQWIIGRGWNQELWGLGRFPTAAELDTVVADRPVVLERVDGHATWVNSKAMELAGVTAQTRDPAGGRIERVAGTRNPSGVFVDAASPLIYNIVPEPRPRERDLALQKAQDKLLSMGITAAADMGTSLDDWQAFRRAGDRGSLKLRIMAYAAGVEAMEKIAGPGPTPWLYDDKLRLNGVKLYLDGALGSRGAWLKRPYSDDAGNTGLPILRPDQLRNMMSRAAMDNFQIAVHAIGDAANDEVLSAIEELAATYEGDRRWRIEHAQVVDPADLGRFGKYGIIASMQPIHQTSDRLMAQARLGPDRLDGAYAWRSIEEAGARLALGSDAPVESPDPFAGWATAFTREDAQGQPFGGWLPQERVTREEGLAGFSADAAYAGFADGRFGRLVIGERADFVVLDRDPMLASPEGLRSARVLETWIGGERVFAADGK